MHGIHHVTAIAGRPNVNFDFYTRTLGLRFVKKTVNFDDPGTYHFYYGDEAGSPGTILTFFPWEHAAQGRGGSPQIRATSGMAASRPPERMQDNAAGHKCPAVSFEGGTLRQLAG